MPFEELADGVFRRRYAALDQNIGLIVGSESCLVIDTRSIPRHAEEILADVGRITDQPVGWVVNTHWHWDHVLGNSAFGDSEIWGHERCRRVMAEDPDTVRRGARRWLDAADAAAVDAAAVIPPTETFADTAQIDMGNRIVQLEYRGRGHTDADVAIRAGGVLFMGDLLEEGAPPVFADGYTMEWPETVAAHLHGAFDLAVPGHGDVMTPAAARGQLDELRDVARRCAAATSAEDLELADAPYPPDVMRVAYARSST